jgi:hypothetical protein
MLIPVDHYRRRKPMIRSIQARGHMVEIKSDENGTQLITRKEALQRARGIIGLDDQAQDFVEALVKAADDARFNETGRRYSSKNKEALLAVAAQGG